MAETFLGYAVEPTGLKNVAYKLYSPNGTVYTLCRNAKEPTMLFAINASGSVCRPGGHRWFTDRHGVLEPA